MQQPFDSPWIRTATVLSSEVLPSSNAILLHVELQPSQTKCRARLATGFAGVAAGLVILPRPGDEVLVLFPDADLNAGVAIAGIHNGVNKVPPSIQPRHTEVLLEGRPGDSFTIRVHGNVTVTIQGERAQTTLGQSRDTVARDRTEATGGDLFTATAGNALHLTGDTKTELVAGVPALDTLLAAAAPLEALLGTVAPALDAAVAGATIAAGPLAGLLGQGYTLIVNGPVNIVATGNALLATLGGVTVATAGTTTIASLAPVMIAAPSFVLVDPADPSTPVMTYIPAQGVTFGKHVTFTAGVTGDN